VSTPRRASAWQSCAAAVLAFAIANACSKSEDATIPAPPAREQAQVVQRALTLPPDAASTPPQRPADPAAMAPAAAALAMTPPNVPGALSVGASSSMVRLLGLPPALPPGSGSTPADAAHHLYHLGAVSFFFDHEELSLTPDQRARLSSIRETAVLGYATVQREIDQAEQDLWTLTSVPRPNAGGVEAKLTEIASLSTQQRMNYIRAVGQAVAQLTHAQQMVALAPPGSGAVPVPMTAGSASSTPPMPMPTPMPTDTAAPSGSGSSMSGSGSNAMGHM
jgi:Spy/CpxP family protein refolding chaperone